MDNCPQCKHYVYGFCRRYPPQVYPSQVRDGYGTEWTEAMSAWPVVGELDTCGEYAERKW